LRSTRRSIEDTSDLKTAIVGETIGKQTHRELSPGTVDTVNGDSANRIINLQDILNETSTYDNENASNCTNDTGTNRTYITARRSDSNESSQQTIAHHTEIWPPGTGGTSYPGIKHRGDGAKCASQHRVSGDDTDAQGSIARSTKCATRIETEPAKREN